MPRYRSEQKERQPDRYALLHAAGQRAAREAVTLPQAWQNAGFRAARAVRFEELSKKTRTDPDAILFHR